MALQLTLPSTGIRPTGHARFIFYCQKRLPKGLKTPKVGSRWRPSKEKKLEMKQSYLLVIAMAIIMIAIIILFFFTISITTGGGF